MSDHTEQVVKRDTARYLVRRRSYHGNILYYYLLIC